MLVYDGVAKLGDQVRYTFVSSAPNSMLHQPSNLGGAPELLFMSVCELCVQRVLEIESEEVRFAYCALQIGFICTTCVCVCGGSLVEMNTGR